MKDERAPGGRMQFDMHGVLVVVVFLALVVAYLYFGGY